MNIKKTVIYNGGQPDIVEEGTLFIWFKGEHIMLAFGQTDHWRLWEKGKSIKECIYGTAEPV